MKAIFNDDGSMFMVGPDHMPDMPGRETVWFPDDLDFRKEVDIDGEKHRVEVSRSELAQRYSGYMENYINARKLEYPSFADQFDLLYHGGYDAWRAAIDAVKSKYPKPDA